MLAFFKAIGKFISGSGLMTIDVDSEVIANGSVDVFLQGKHFNRCKRLHPLMAAGLEILYFEFFLKKTGLSIDDNTRTELMKINDEPSATIFENKELSKIINTYSAHKERCKEGVFGKTAQLYITYIDLVNYYRLLSRSIRSGDFQLFKYILSNISSLFFVTNQPNYARWLQRYYDNLLKLNETHPDLERAMNAGYLGIQRTSKSFSRQPIDLTLEQTINADAGRKLTGVIHFTNSI